MSFRVFRCYYDGVLIGEVTALHHASALEKACQLAGVSASAYSGRSSRLVTVESA